MIDIRERRILIYAPLGKDAELAAQVLNKEQLVCYICKTWSELISELGQGAGTVLTVEEALTPTTVIPLTSYISRQPTWSDMPVLVLTKSGDSTWIKDAYDRLGNLTLLERPVRASTLVSTTRSALRARLRQYEIKQLDQRKDEFLAMLAHELRNPLAPISSSAEILKLISTNPEKIKQTSEIIVRQVGHLTNLIDDLLDVARVTRGLIKLEKEPLDICYIVSQAIEQVNPQIVMKQQHLAINFPLEPAQVFGDSKRLIQVVANILNNASKYTQVDGNISVTVEILETDIMLEISDDGIGMSPEMVPQVFDLFAQAKRNSDRSQGGLGLGLALVKSLVVSHNGMVQPLSKGLGEGSTFTIYLPRLMNDYPATDTVPLIDDEKSAEPFHPLDILVVDDNQDAADALATYLETAGHNIFVEYNATNAIARAQAVSPQICILDIGLPDMDGYDLATHLREMPQTRDSILIAVTGYSEDKNRTKSMAAGFNHHFVKPVEVDTLINAIVENTKEKS